MTRIAIYECEKCGQWQQALLLLLLCDMRCIARTVIYACEKGGHWQQALLLLLLYDMRCLARRISKEKA